MTTAEFPNLQSRLLLKPLFDRQFIVPETPPWLLETFLRAYERLMSIDLERIPLDRPVFLIGLPRSGTSMLQDILCTHQHVGYVTNAMHQFRRCFCAAEVWRKRLNLNARGERYLGDSVEVDAGSPNDAVGFWAEWLKWDGHSLDYVPRRLADFSADEVTAVRTAIRKILWCFGPNCTRFFAKNPGLIPEVPLLNELFPDARWVHIVRDPRQCANSMRKLYRLEQEQLARIKSVRPHGMYDERPFVPYPRLPRLSQLVAEYGADDLRTTAHLWNDAIAFVRAHRSALPNFCEVRYEDILADPATEIMRLIDHCELDRAGIDNARFRDKLSHVGVVKHENRYGDFELIGDICRELMDEYRYR
jgi:hypothetical protein